MSAELDEKWRELVAAGKAKWMPGMLWWHSERAFERYELADGQRPIEHGAAPDWSDPATLGALLGQVREAWGDPYVYAMRLNVRRQIWVVHVPSDRHNIHGEGGTEAAALVAALEAAP
tara:strand:- start:88 stop:441 length:354 start_codon:yes stop_codon:yes gene_type:complete